MKVIVGDCVEVMRGMEPDSIDAIVTDPPYDLTAGKKGGTGPASVNLDSPYGRARITTGFMGKAWDGTGVAFDVETWRAALRVLKPGAHLFAFGSPRTYHRMTCAIEDAGFEVRESCLWLHGQGFPKSLDVSKALDRAAGAEREVVGTATRKNDRDAMSLQMGRVADEFDITAPATDLARQWDGWGTALKPAYEPIVLARKPLMGTVAANVARYGTGALNIDACRIGTGAKKWETPRGGIWSTDTSADASLTDNTLGRWPANVILGCACDGDPHDPECAAAMLDAQSGERTSGVLKVGTRRSMVNPDFPHWLQQEVVALKDYGGDTGGASRFFYVAKSSRAEREAWGRMTLPPERRTDGRTKDIENPRLRTSERVNHHATVKPLALMEWLIKLVLPPGGVLLDPFCGSGSTLVAARRLNVEAIGIEQDESYAEIARQRISAQWEVRML